MPTDRTQFSDRLRSLLATAGWNCPDDFAEFESSTIESVVEQCGDSALEIPFVDEFNTSFPYELAVSENATVGQLIDWLVVNAANEE